MKRMKERVPCPPFFLHPSFRSYTTLSFGLTFGDQRRSKIGPKEVSESERKWEKRKTIFLLGAP